MRGMWENRGGKKKGGRERRKIRGGVKTGGEDSRKGVTWSAVPVAPAHYGPKVSKIDALSPR